MTGLFIVVMDPKAREGTEEFWVEVNDVRQNREFWWMNYVPNLILEQVLPRILIIMTRVTYKKIIGN